MKPLTDTQKAVLRTFSRTGIATTKEMAKATIYWQPALRSLIRRKFVSSVLLSPKYPFGIGQYALTVEGGKVMPEALGEIPGYEKE